MRHGKRKHNTSCLGILCALPGDIAGGLYQVLSRTPVAKFCTGLSKHQGREPQPKPSDIFLFVNIPEILTIYGIAIIFYLCLKVQFYSLIAYMEIFSVVMMTGKTYCILPSVCNERQHDFPIILNAMIAISQRHE